MRSSGVQNLRGLGHLQHEGGLRVGQIIGCSDAGVDGVDWPQTAGGSWHVAAHAGQQNNQGHLAHVGGFAAHVGAGNYLHALLGTQARVIGDEVSAGKLCQPRLHHRVAPLSDVDAGLGHKLRGIPVQRQRTFGQGAQRVQRSQCAGHAGELGDEGLQMVQHLLKEPLFARQCPLLRAEGFVFKGFEFRGNESLGVFECLAAAVVVGHLVGLPGGDFNVKTVHPVELHPQVGDTGAGLFAHLQVQQKRVAVGLDATQFVQIGVKAVGNHATIAHQRGWFWGNGGAQQSGAVAWGLQFLAYMSQIAL